jgi:hypothetical protein
VEGRGPEKIKSERIEEKKFGVRSSAKKGKRNGGEGIQGKIEELSRSDLSPYDFNCFFDNLSQFIFLDGTYPVQDDMIVCGE